MFNTIVIIVVFMLLAIVSFRLVRSIHRHRERRRMEKWHRIQMYKKDVMQDFDDFFSVAGKLGRTYPSEKKQLEKSTRD